MTYWKAPRNPRLHEGSTFIVLGGGPSLRKGDKALLGSVKVIGTQEAYGRHKDIKFTAVLFDSLAWYEAHRGRLEADDVLAFTTRPELNGTIGIHILHPQINGVSRAGEGKISVNRSIEAAAVNLAAIFGARSVALVNCALDPHKHRALNKAYHPHDKSDKSKPRVVNCNKGKQPDSAFQTMTLAAFIESTDNSGTCKANRRQHRPVPVTAANDQQGVGE